MPSRHITIPVTIPNPGRHAEEEWQSIEPQEADFWKAAADDLSHRVYEHKGCRVAIQMDWAPLGRRIIRDHNLLTPVRTGKAWEEHVGSKLRRPLKLVAQCEIEGENDLSKYPWYAVFFIEYYFYEIFTIANLACPGSAEFHNISVQQNAPFETSALRLSAFYFNEWMIDTVRGEKPAAQLLPLQATIAWFRQVNPRVTQKAENSTQRALYALYQLCRSDGQIDFILWLFNALESLLSTRVGENFSGLVRRAALLLQLNERETSTLSKKLRKLYEVRSAFVHGGYQIAHPLHREPIDERLNDDYSELLSLGKYGFFVLSSLLQAMVVKGIPTLQFEERIALPKDAL